MPILPCYHCAKKRSSLLYRWYGIVFMILYHWEEILYGKLSSKLKVVTNINFFLYLTYLVYFTGSYKMLHAFLNLNSCGVISYTIRKAYIRLLMEFGIYFKYVPVGGFYNVDYFPKWSASCIFWHRMWNLVTKSATKIGFKTNILLRRNRTACGLTWFVSSLT